MTENLRWQTRQDGLDKLFSTTGPVPTPGDDEVLVKIKTVSLNYRDTEGKPATTTTTTTSPPPPARTAATFTVTG